MKNKSTLLILLSIFILFAFLQGVTALDDNSTIVMKYFLLIIIR